MTEGKNLATQGTFHQTSARTFLGESALVETSLWNDILKKRL